jgi:hypothetical protein
MAREKRDLSIETYNAEEFQARCHVSYTEIMAFAPSTLNLFGFPATVAAEQEIARYVDWNNSTSNYQYFQPDHFVRGPSVETRFTDAEASAIGRVSDSVAALTQRRYGRAMRPISTLLSQMGLFRAIMALQTRAAKALTVFEVGPGNGYLAALLANAGVNYIGFDNAQSLYLWQNRLLAECSDDFYEWVASGPPGDTQCIRAQHLAWWHYLQLRHHCPIDADILVSNTNLGEMNYGALQFTTRIARKLLGKSKLAAFLFTNIGDAKQNSMATVEGELSNAGFEKVCADLLHAYVPKDIRQRSALKDLDAKIPLFNPHGSKERYQTREVLRVTEETLPMDMDFLSFVGTFTLPK